MKKVLNLVVQKFRFKLGGYYWAVVGGLVEDEFSLTSEELTYGKTPWLSCQPSPNYSQLLSSQPNFQETYLQPSRTAAETRSEIALTSKNSTSFHTIQQETTLLLSTAYDFGRHNTLR